MNLKNIAFFTNMNTLANLSHLGYCNNNVSALAGKNNEIILNRFCRLCNLLKISMG
jgi:DNA-binding Xre family transcriptional regulator